MHLRFTYYKVLINVLGVGIDKLMLQNDYADK